VRSQQRIDALVLRRIIVEPKAQKDVGVDADHWPDGRLAARLAGCMLGARMLRPGFIDLLDAERFGMRGLQQAPDVPTIGLDMPGGDRVVGLDLEVEDRSGVQAS
jgi:hypothetical protein